MQNDNEAKMMRKRTVLLSVKNDEHRTQISLVIECQQVAFGNWNNQIYM